MGDDIISEKNCKNFFLSNEIVKIKDKKIRKLPKGKSNCREIILHNFESQETWAK